MPGLARAEATAKTLEGVEKRIEQDRAEQERLDRQAQRAQSEAARLRRDLVTAATAAQKQEKAVAAAERRLAKATRNARAARLALGHQKGQLVRTLAALERLALYPTATRIAAPAGPNETLRSALVLRSVVPALEARSASLRERLGRLESSRRKAVAERRALTVAARELTSRRKTLTSLLARKSRLAAHTEADRKALARRMARLTREAANLRDLLRKIEQQHAIPPAGPKTAHNFGKPPEFKPLSAAHGRMRMPVEGRIAGRFGDAKAIGGANKGLHLETLPGAQVVAPYDGKVAFAGQFRGYGQILIIEHGGGYHSLLAGFSRIDSVPDQWLLAGEPVGVMGGAETGNPSLYVELRKDGRSINPLPWLAANN